MRRLTRNDSKYDRLGETATKHSLSSRMSQMKLPEIEQRHFFRKFDLFEKKAYNSTESFYKKGDQEDIFRKTEPHFIRKRLEVTNIKIQDIKGKIVKRSLSSTAYWPVSINKKLDADSVIFFILTNIEND